MNKQGSATFVAAIALLMWLTGCASDPVVPSEPSEPATFIYQFDRGDDGWMLSASEAAAVLAVRDMPYGFDGDGVHMQSESNGAGTIFFAQKQISGLEPAVEYRVYFSVGAVYDFVRIGTDDAQTASSVHSLNVGASTSRPQPRRSSAPIAIDQVGFADRASGLDYVARTSRSVRLPALVQADETGSLWATVAIDSSFMGAADVYVSSIMIEALQRDEISVTFEPPPGGGIVDERPLGALLDEGDGPLPACLDPENPVSVDADGDGRIDGCLPEE